jgi:hypothetical protein
MALKRPMNLNQSYTHKFSVSIQRLQDKVVIHPNSMVLQNPDLMSDNSGPDYEFEGSDTICSNKPKVTRQKPKRHQIWS